MQRLSGKTAIISGASRGIGAETARAFVEAGAKVALLARSEAAIADLAAQLGPAALAIPCDVSRYWEVAAAVDATQSAFGAVDVLINNAGVIEPISHMHRADPDAWSHVIDINLKGVFYAVRAVLPTMIERGEGTILTVSSGAAHGPVEAWSHYCASKAGAAMITRSIHLEAGPKGVRAMGLSPGTVATQMQREIKASGINRVSQLDWADHIPADWPAKALLWMTGPAADPYLGEELSLRDESLRREIGLIP